MEENFIFWAQALDNSSSDHIRVGKKDLTPEGVDQRQKAVSLVSAVVKTGRCVFEKQSVRLFADGKHFVVEVISAQCDQVGRIAPIVCYGEYDKNICGNLGDEIISQLQQFAAAIGRNIRLTPNLETLLPSIISTQLGKTHYPQHKGFAQRFRLSEDIRQSLQRSQTELSPPHKTDELQIDSTSENKPDG